LTLIKCTPAAFSCIMKASSERRSATTNIVI